MSRSNPTTLRTLAQRLLPGSFFEAFIAWRIIRSRKKRALSVITLISITGIILGVMALTIVLGITGGFQNAFRERILGMYPHLVILKRAGDFHDYRRVTRLVAGVPGVVGASPATSNEMMATSKGHRSGVIVKGIDLPTVDGVSNLRSLVIEGSLDLLDESPRVVPGPTALTVGNLVEGTAHTIATVRRGGELRAFPIPDEVATPELGMVKVRLVNLSPASAPLTLRAKVHQDAGDAPDSASTRWRAPPAPAGLGTATAYLTLDPRHAVIEVMAEGDREPVGLLEKDLEPDGTWSIFVSGEGEHLVLDLRKDDAERPPEGQALVRLYNGGGSAMSLQVEGEPVETIPDVAPGSLSGYAQAKGRLPGIVLGVRLAERLHAGEGDEVTLVSPLRGIDNKMLGPFGMAPTSARYTVSGVFDSGFHEYDVRLSLVDFRAAQRFLNRGDVAQWIDVRFDDVLMVKARSNEVRAAIDPYTLPDFTDSIGELEARMRRAASGEIRGYPMGEPDDLFVYLRNVSGVMHLMSRQPLDFGVSERFRLIDWEEMNHNLFSALKLQKVVLSIFFLIIIVVAAFNVVGSQIMIVHEKTANIAILKSMGASSWYVKKIFLLQGFMVSAAGTLVGLALGLVVCVIMKVFGYPLDPEVYLIRTLPVEIDLPEFALVAAGALLFTFLAIQYSAGRAARKTPVEGLRQLE